MFKADLSVVGAITMTAGTVVLAATVVHAEPYGGFDAVRDKYVRIDYGPRYEGASTTIRYVDTPTYVNYERTYTRPTYGAARIIDEAPVAEYVAPVRYRRVYVAPRRVLHISPVVRFGGCRHDCRPRACHRHDGLFGHFLAPRPFRHYRHVGHHPRSWGLSIGGGHGYGGGYGGFSFHYSR